MNRRKPRWSSLIWPLAVLLAGGIWFFLNFSGAGPHAASPAQGSESKLKVGSLLPPSERLQLYSPVRGSLRRPKCGPVLQGSSVARAGEPGDAGVSPLAGHPRPHALRGALGLCRDACGGSHRGDFESRRRWAEYGEWPNTDQNPARRRLAASRHASHPPDSANGGSAGTAKSSSCARSPTCTAPSARGRWA